MEQQKQRIEFIDLAKGICICLVVYNHIVFHYPEVYSPLHDMFYGIRMPLYFFLSGLFFKPYDGFWDFTVRKINKLLVPFVAFHFLTAVVWMVATDLLAHRFALQTSCGYVVNFIVGPYREQVTNQPIWFLLCLFEMNLIFVAIICALNRFGQSVRIIGLLLITFLIGAVGYIVGAQKLSWPMYIDTSMTALPFFSMGFIVRKYTKFLLPNRFDRYNIFFCAALAVMSFVLLTGDAEFWCNRYNGLNIMQLYVGCLAGLLAILLLSKMMRHIPLVSYFGRYSIIILVTHMFLFPYVQRAVDYLRLPVILMLIITFICTMLAYLVVIPLFKRYLPHITAQKDLFRLPGEKA